MQAPVETHPVQTKAPIHKSARISTKVTLAAYEVYCVVFGPQEALIDDAGKGCRGGFGAGELMALLYARAYRRAEWRQRFYEACEGMEQL